MKPKHKHLIVRAEVELPFRKGDEQKTSDWLTELVSSIGMKIVGGPYVGFANAEGNTGITSCVLIETSHVALHIWDAESPPIVQLDVYTCSDLNLDIVFHHMDCMKPSKVEYKYLDREFGLKEIFPEG